MRNMPIYIDLLCKIHVLSHQKELDLVAETVALTGTVVVVAVVAATIHEGKAEHIEARVSTPY